MSTKADPNSLRGFPSACSNGRFNLLFFNVTFGNNLNNFSDIIVCDAPVSTVIQQDTPFITPCIYIPGDLGTPRRILESKLGPTSSRFDLQLDLTLLSITLLHLPSHRTVSWPTEAAPFSLLADQMMQKLLESWRWLGRHWILGLEALQDSEKKSWVGLPFAFDL